MLKFFFNSLTGDWWNHGAVSLRTGPIHTSAQIGVEKMMAKFRFWAKLFTFVHSNGSELAVELNLGAQDEFMASKWNLVCSCLLQLHFVSSSDKTDFALSIGQLQWLRDIPLSENICNFVVSKFKHRLYELTPRIASNVQKPRVKEY